jgi:hypothetical protein
MNLEFEMRKELKLNKKKFSKYLSKSLFKKRISNNSLIKKIE